MTKCESYKGRVSASVIVVFLTTRAIVRVFVCVGKEVKDQQWKQAMDYLSAVTELNYMTQIVIMLYEDNNKVGLQAARCSSSTADPPAA